MAGLNKLSNTLRHKCYSDSDRPKIALNKGRSWMPSPLSEI